MRPFKADGANASAEMTKLTNNPRCERREQLITPCSSSLFTHKLTNPLNMQTSESPGRTCGNRLHKTVFDDEFMCFWALRMKTSIHLSSSGHIYWQLWIVGLWNYWKSSKTVVTTPSTSIKQPQQNPLSSDWQVGNRCALDFEVASTDYARVPNEVWLFLSVVTDWISHIIPYVLYQKERIQ